MIKSKETITLKYKGGFITPAAGTSTNQQEALMLQAEVMQLGYIFDQDLFYRISTLPIDKIVSIYNKIVPILQNLKIANKKWKAFYPNFPKQVIKASEQELYYNAILHYWSYGTWIPVYKASNRVPKMESVKFITLSRLEEADYFSIFSELLESNISLSESNIEDLEWIVSTDKEEIIPHVPQKITFKETLCSFIGCCIQHKIDVSFLSTNTTTDILRIMTYLSGGDISLAENTKFRSWKRIERRAFLKMLERVINRDDIARHGEKWKRAFHGLHLGDYAKQFPKSYAIASLLRNGKIITYNSRVEQAIKTQDSEILIKLLKSRPGELARRLDHLIRSFGATDRDHLLNTFSDVAEQIDTRVLLQLLGHFKTRHQSSTRRIVMPKAMQSKARVLKKVLPALPKASVDKVLTIIHTALREKFAQKDTLGSVWIDTNLSKCPVPLAQRSTSDTLRALARGTRLPLGDKNTLRMFVWWVGEDIDLSCVLYDKAFNKKGNISYTNLKIQQINCCHSGDITNAPNGAAEFIDIDIAQAVQAGVRYITMNVLDYSGLKFSGYNECYAGWMTRDYPNNNEIYDPKTAEQKIDLRAPSRLATPVLFDLVNREAVWLDLNGHVKSSLPNNVESNAATILEFAQAALLLSDKVNLYDLFKLHADARGELVEAKEDADTIFSLDEGVTPFDIVKISSEYVA